VELSGSSMNRYVVEYGERGNKFVVLRSDSEPSPPIMKSAIFSSDGTSILVKFDSPTNRGGYVNVFGCGLLLSSLSNININNNNNNNNKISSSTRCVWLDDESFLIYPTLSISSSSSSSSSTTTTIISKSNLLEVKDKLILRNSTIRAKCQILSNNNNNNFNKPCNEWKSSSSTIISISPPSQILLPIVSIVSPHTIGSCDSLSIDLSGSKGSGGRSFLNVSFEVFKIIEEEGNEVIIEENIGNNNITNNKKIIISTTNKTTNNNNVNISIVSYLYSKSSLTSPFSIPSGYCFFPGFSYKIKVKICNFLGGCGESSHNLKVLKSESVPIVSINSNKTRSMKRKSILMISGQGSMLDCKKVSISNLKYDWNITLLQSSSSSSIKSTTTILKSISNDPKSFRLPSYSLSVGSIYLLTLTVTSDSKSSSSSSITINVIKGDIIGLVSGSVEKMLSLDGSILIDVSGSYDEDMNLESSSNLLYSYSCIQLEPSYKSFSFLNFLPFNNFNNNNNNNQNNNENNYYNLKSNSFISSSIMKVSVINSTLVSMVGSVHEIKIIVKERFDNRTSVVKVKVKIVSPESPRISIISEGGNKINPSDKLKLSGEVISSFESSGLLLWSINDESISLEDVSLSDIKRRIIPSSSSSNLMRITKISLVLPSNILPQQSTFTFTLQFNSSSFSLSSSSITITTNSPPLPGIYEVSPSNGGLMLETVFSFVASQWEDEDIPISYEFSYQSPFSSTNYLVHRSRQEISYSSSKLPSSNNGNKLLLTQVKVFDILDGKSSSFMSVEVLEKKISSLEIQNILESSLLSSEGDVEEMTKSISLGSSVINSVDCSKSPVCSSLNRENCMRKEGSCGSCLSGYIGEEGDSNSICKSISSFSLNSLSSLKSLNSEIKSKQFITKQLNNNNKINNNNNCKSNSDCNEDNWEECNIISGKCEIQSKKCSNNCSNVGRCVFVSKYNKSEYLSECNVLDVDCESYCDCFEGYVGISCGLVVDDFKRLSESRHKLVESLNRLSLIGEENVNNVKFWLEGLSSISIDSSLIEDETKYLMGILSLRYLNVAKELKMSYEDISSVGNILDLILDINLNNNNITNNSRINITNNSRINSTRSELILSLLNSYNSFIQGDMVIGQKSVSVMNNLFRVTHYSVDNFIGSLSSSSESSSSESSSNSIISLFPPRSQIEELTNSPYQIIKIPLNITESGMKISIIESKVSSINEYYYQSQSQLNNNNNNENNTISKSNIKTSLSFPSSFISIPIGIKFSSSPCNSSSSSSSSSSSCVSEITLRKIPLSSKLEIESKISRKLISSQTINNENNNNENKDENDKEFVEVKCIEGNSSFHDKLCSNGDMIRLNCNGSSSGILRRYCPIHNSSVICSSLFDDRICVVKSESENDISCECSLFNISSPSISSSSNSDSSISLNIGLMVKSTVKEFVDTWLSVDDLSAKEVGNNVTVLLSTIGVAFIGGLLVLFSFELDKRDEDKIKKRESEMLKESLKSHSKSEMKSESRLSLFSLSFSNNNDNNNNNNNLSSSNSIIMRSTSFLQRSLSSSFIFNQTNNNNNNKLNRNNYNHRKALVRSQSNVIGLIEEKRIEDSLPIVMRPVPIIDKCKTELQMSHRWFAVYFHYSSAYSRPYRVLSLWMNIVIMLFIQSVTYNLADPDDGSCERKESIEDCLKLKSSLSNGDKCMWNEEKEKCLFRPLDGDFERVLIVAIISGVLSAPFSILFQSLILFVLSAKTKVISRDRRLSSRVGLGGGGGMNRRVGLQNQLSSKLRGVIDDVNNNMMRIESNVSNISNLSNNELFSSDIIFTVDSLPTTLAEDLGMLLKKLRLYRDKLNEKEKEEFEYAWGREETGNEIRENAVEEEEEKEMKEIQNNNKNNNKIILNINIIERMFDFVKEMIIFREKSSYENILMELGNVRKIVCREACYFKNPMIDEESKKKRLNLLFVKDLLDGVNGMILDHKDRRDNEIKSQVELWKKVLGWIFLLIVSMGMLFYIYLFAMRQSSNRQRAWFNSFQVWLFFEIFIVSTGLVLVEHVLIPLWSMKEV